MAEAGRVQAPDINLRPQLQAAPRVNVSPVAPVNQAGAGSNLMRIAESLGSLTNVFQSIASTSGRSQKNAKTEADKNFVKINQWRDPADIPNQPGYDPASEPQQVLIGQATANSIAPKMQEWVKNEWDPEKEPDLYKFLSGRLGELQGQMPEPAQAGFGSTIDTSVRETMKWWDGVQSDKKNLEMKQNTFAHFVSLNDLYKDLPVEERVQKMKEMGLDQYRTLKFTDGKGGNDLLMDAVTEFARRGDKDMVRALSDLRRGKDGEVPALYDMPDFRDRIDAATAKADAEWVKTHQAEVGDFDTSVETVVAGGDVNKLTEYFNSPTALKLYPNPAERGEKLRAAAKKLNENVLTSTVDNEKAATINTHTTTAVRNFWSSNGSQKYGEVKVRTKDQKEHTWNGDKEAQTAVDADIKAQYEAAAGDPEAIAALDKRIARSASNSPLKVTEWENLFSGALNSSVTNALLEGKVPPNLKRAYELYSNTKDTPRVVRSNMGENSEQTDTFFSLVDTFKTAGYGENEAFVAANEAQPRAGAALGRVSEELLGKNSGSYDIRSYPMDVQDKITKRAQAYMASGTMGQEKAVTKALRDFDEETVKIEDFGSRPSIINIPDKAINKDVFKESITRFVTNQVDIHGKQQDLPLNIDDVNIFDYGNGRFGLQRDDGEPITSFFTHRGGEKTKGTMFFTFDDVQRQLQADAAEAKSVQGAEAAKFDETKKDVMSGKPIVPGGGSAIGNLFDKLGTLEDKTANEPKSAVDAYGATNGDGLRKLNDDQLREVYTQSKNGKLNSSGFVTDKSVKDEYEYRLRKAVVDDLGYTDKGEVERINKEAKKRGFRDAIQLRDAVSARSDTGYSLDQVVKAMQRWSTDDPAEAIKRLKANNAKPDN